MVIVLPLLLLGLLALFLAWVSDRRDKAAQRAPRSSAEMRRLMRRGHRQERWNRQQANWQIRPPNKREP